MKSPIIHILSLMLFLSTMVTAQKYSVIGIVIDSDTNEPVEFASIMLSESGLWAITNSEGQFTLKNVPKGKNSLSVQCLGYSKRTFTMELTRNITDMTLRIKPQNLKLNEVTVVAKRKTDEATTSYIIDRQTLDNQQLINVSDIQTLLPGGKTVNSTLMNDNRISLRSGQSEMGNASFGTAIEIDGMRLDNNAMLGETMGASTRSLNTLNIESVEIVTGIPSVEYGDLSNGLVKVNTRMGKSPFIVEGKINQHTRQIAITKGFDLSERGGILNTSFDHARSFSNAASPYTAYVRNALSLRYMNIFMRETTPITFNVGITTNIGGYNSEADPDETRNDYSKVRDNSFRFNTDFQWLLNKSWITNFCFSGNISYSDRKTEDYSSTSSATTLPYIHATEEGYFIADQSPTGYWYTQRYNDSKPLSWKAKIKADWTHRFGKTANKILLGTDYSGSRNNGAGTYYSNPLYTPTWREYNYDALPTMHNIGIYAEEKIVIPTTKKSTFELTAGLRNDITIINNSDYGNVSGMSPRTNARYIFWRNQRKKIINDLIIHAGWGKSLKLPSFQVLYPAPTYTDREAFASTSDSTNRTFRAYHTLPSKAQWNPNLSWQYTTQTDFGIESTISGVRVALSGFYHSTRRAYMSTESFTPFSYLFTVDPNSAVIPAENRQFSIDRYTGQVTMSDVTGKVAPSTLTGTIRKTFSQSQTYINSSRPIERYGLEWIVDVPTIKKLRSSIRLDGNYYHYKGIDETLFADIPLGTNTHMSNGDLYQYVGYYRGTITNSTSNVASASISNGSISKQLNLNATVTTHIPKIRLIIALRFESTLYSYKRELSQLHNDSRGYVIEEANSFTGQPYDGTSTDKSIVVYPEYYTTWDNPSEMIPFAEKFLWAKDNDPTLFNDLSKLVLRSNYAYTMNPNRLTAYYSANINITKEIGDNVSISFYANNFFRNMKTIHSSQTNLETSLFSSSYIPNFYYGLSLRLKL